MDTMRKPKLVIALIWMFTLITTAASAQHYANDFENLYEWYPPWSNIHILVDSTATPGHYVCYSDSLHDYGLGFRYEVPKDLNGRNLSLDFEADYRFPDTIGNGEVVITLLDSLNHTRYWNSYDLNLYAVDSAKWFHVALKMNLPNDYLKGSILKLFLWKRTPCQVLIDNANINFSLEHLPSFLPNIREFVNDSITEKSFVLRQGSNDSILSYPIGMAVEYIIGDDTLSEFNPFVFDYDHGFLSVSGIDSTVIFKYKNSLYTNSRFTRECKLLRQALVIPFVDSTLTVYRRNMLTDTAEFQPEYYLDREGFKVGNGERSVIAYHQRFISSTQFDAEHRTAWFNLDYWRDHPMIHYPLSDSIEDYFEDRSCRHVYEGMAGARIITLTIGNDLTGLPRIMQVPEGYESGIVFSEHADWTDLRTHRATYFGNEHITKAEDAVGGFVYYGIPVTKSVFYNNPDGVTNYDISHGVFPGPHATIKGGKEFERFLKQLHKLGYEICLHTPEQYSTNPKNLKKALNYMRRNFQSVSWIDHGYNNGRIHNRENLVCDAFNSESEQYAAHLWLQNGIRYLWNAYYEENRMEQWCFDNNILQPYPGFGDALPNRQITVFPGFGYFDFTLWSTPSTLDANSDDEWNFYYSEERLQRIVDNHSVHITHVYPAWVNPARAFWTYDEDSTITALPGMNQALARIAALRDERKMLPMTVKTYLDHYRKLNNVVYTVVDAEHIKLQNLGDDINGFTLLCPSPIHFEDNRHYDSRETEEGYYVWFDFKSQESIIISIEHQ